MNKGIVFSSLLLILLFSCNTAKNVPKNQWLLKDVRFNLNNQIGDISGSDLADLVRQKTNTRILKIPFRLLVFNAVDSAKVANKREKETSKIKARNANKSIRVDKINAMRIEKARAKGNEFYKAKTFEKEDELNPRKFLRQWLKEDYGQKPVIFDSSLLDNSRDQIRIYLRKRGYYESKVSASVAKDVKKRSAKILFEVNTGAPILIDSIFYKGNPSLISIFNVFMEDEKKRNTEYPLLGKSLDEDVLSDIARLATIDIRNEGLFGFTTDNIRYFVDTNMRTKKAKLTIEFLDRKMPHPLKKDSLMLQPFVKYTVSRVVFHLGDSNSLHVPFNTYKLQRLVSNEGDDVERGFLETYESLLYKKIKCDKNAAKRSGLTLDDFNPYRVVELYYNGDKPGVKPHLLEQQNYLEPTNIYKEKYLARSFQYLSQLNLFNSIKSSVIENSFMKTLEIHYFLSRSKMQTFAFEPRFTSSFGLLGVNASINYSHKNLFRGGERLNISLGGGFDTQPVVFEDEFKKGIAFNTFEFGPSLKLEIPGLLPVPNRLLSKRQKPNTQFNLAANIEHRDIFDRSVVQLSYTWKWLVGKTQIFSVGLPLMSTIKFVRFENSPEFQNQINALNDLFLRNSYSNQLIWEDFKFQFDWSNIAKDFRGDNPKAVRKMKADLHYLASLSVAGNTLHWFNKNADTLPNGVQTVLGNPFAQFIRIDNQFNVNKKFTSKLRLAGKLNFGLGIPYGNSITSMPYDYSFFGGGPNDNRGWKARALGPGIYKSYLDSNGTATQLGDIKMFGSLEFRFPLLKDFSSCVFSDFGNIWTYRKDENREGAEFTKNFYKQFTFSLGTGLRLDLSILVVRLDIGFPIFNPSLPDNSRWVFENRQAYYEKGVTYYGINTGNTQDDLNTAKVKMPRPFLPSLNFGIGLPF